MTYILYKYDGAGFLSTTPFTGSGGGSFAFGPDGAPAFSYNGSAFSDVYFSRFDGNAYHPSSIAQGVNNGQTCIAFGPDGMPAVVYIASTGKLRIARYGFIPSAP